MTVQFSEGEIKELNVGLQPLPVEPASLVGQVTDITTALSIPGVLVELVGLTSTTTAADGMYSIINIPPGSYTLRFSHSDYETIEY